MGDVSLTLRVLPDGVSVDLGQLEKKLKAALPKKARINKASVVPFAFGLKALMVNVIVPDESGISDAVEEAFRGVPNVQGVDVVDMGRLM